MINDKIKGMPSIIIIFTDRKRERGDRERERVGGGGCAAERRTVNRGDAGSIPPTAVSKFRQFRSPHICLCVFRKRH